MCIYSLFNPWLQWNDGDDDDDDDDVDDDGDGNDDDDVDDDDDVTDKLNKQTSFDDGTKSSLPHLFSIH